VHKYMRTHESEEATEPSRDGPGPVGPSRTAWPTPGASSASFFLHPKILQPHVAGGAAIRKTKSHSPERPSKS
jgi:hypothetical protein